MSFKKQKNAKKHPEKTANVREHPSPCKTTGKLYYKCPKGHLPRKTTQRGHLVHPKQVANVAKFSQPFRFKNKNSTNQNFVFKKLDIPIGREMGHIRAHERLIGPVCTHKPIMDDKTIGMTPRACVSGSEHIRYLYKYPIKSHARTQTVT